MTEKGNCVTKLDPKSGTFSEQIGQFRVTLEDKNFLEQYAHETEVGMVDVIRLAIGNLRRAVQRTKKKAKQEN
jgi:hypothetical protein